MNRPMANEPAALTKSVPKGKPDPSQRASQTMVW